MVTISNEDIALIKKYIDIKNRGMIVQGSSVTQLYNRILNKTATPTSCGGCIKARINELERFLKNYEAEMAKIEEAKKVEEKPQEEPKEEKPKKKKKKSE